MVSERIDNKRLIGKLEGPPLAYFKPVCAIKLINVLILMCYMIFGSGAHEVIGNSIPSLKKLTD